LSVYRPIGDFELNWVIISEIDWTEAMQPVIQFRYYLLGITFFILFLTTIVTLILSNAIARPIQKTQGCYKRAFKRYHSAKEGINKVQGRGWPDGRRNLSIDGRHGANFKFAREIGGGNFNSSFETLSDQDTLGHSLLHMRDELKSLNERELKLARARASALLEGQEKKGEGLFRNCTMAWDSC
jgi:hypothetical protein